MSAWIGQCSLAPGGGGSWGWPEGRGHLAQLQSSSLPATVVRLVSLRLGCADGKSIRYWGGGGGVGGGGE